MDKTIVFEGAGGGTDPNLTAMLSSLLGKNNLDPNLVASLMNNRSGGGLLGGGEGGGILWVIILLALLGRGGGLFGGNAGEAAVPAALHGDAGRELIMNAIQGNGVAIRDLAAALNTSVQNVQTTLCGIGNSITQLSGQVGMSSQQIINSILSGNQTIAAQLAQCCCDVQKDIMTQGYENQLANLNQTNTLTATMNGNNRAVLDRIDAFETNQLRDKIEALREKNQTLQNEISQRNQNDFIYGQTRPIYDRLAAIECKQLPTYPQSFIPGHPTIQYAAPYPFGYGFGHGHGHGHGDCCDKNW